MNQEPSGIEKNEEWKQKLSDNDKKEMQKNTFDLAGKLHDIWRESRKQDDGTYEPRIKVLVKTNGGKEKWLNENQLTPDMHELKRQDIANTEYKDLDPYFQSDNKASAETAMNILYENKVNEKPTNVDKASIIIHDEWLKRNPWAPKEQQLPFDKLSEEEKDKDRVIIKEALNIIIKKGNC